MNPLAEALAPVFIAGFALQQLIELLDPILERIIHGQKAWILSAFAFVASDHGRHEVVERPAQDHQL